MSLEDLVVRLLIKEDNCKSSGKAPMMEGRANLLVTCHNCGNPNQLRRLGQKECNRVPVLSEVIDFDKITKGFRVDCVHSLKVNVSPYQAWRVKKLALHQLKGSFNDQYKYLWPFAHEVRRSNPSSTMIWEIWGWLIRVLKSDLEIQNDSECTFMFDQKKVSSKLVMRYSLMVNTGTKLATVNDFQRRMDALEELDKDAH
ncbi:cytolethal distending toxin subunit A [Striga asiatica]|uniref:Cytolethal distending toxin subunit A n=1 Tax=Striga asiatica TaxID=4170 RepID=A0A5A7PH02_STRAF|nr:cytolethal distending toxin subunit A [Striga asiatica]